MAPLEHDMQLHAGQSPQQTWPECVLNGSEMGERIYHFDWDNHPLGPIKSWPISLQMMVRTILANNFPMYLFWGPEYRQIYNDAFIPLAGHNHPMLGVPICETWSEIWDDIVKPLFTSVTETGKPILIEKQHFPILRFGYLEEVYCLTAYSPLFGDSGEIAGVFVTIAEITGQVLGERRLKALRDLGAQASEARSPQEACKLTAKAIEQHAVELPFALIYLLDSEGREARLSSIAGITDHDHRACPSVIDLTDPQAAWPLQAALTEGSQLVPDFEAHFGTMLCKPWEQTPRCAFVMPIASRTQEQPVGFLVAGINPRREFDEHYLEFMTLVTSQVGASIANALAYEQERKRAEALAEIDRAKTAFFNNVSHEFRTPLTLMLGPVEELLAHADQFPQEDRSHLEILYRNGLRLLRLVNSLLDFSRLEAGRVQACYRPTALAYYTAELASVFRAAIEKAGLTLTIDCPPLDEPVFVDREMWEKIVLNLISNALKFTFQGGITVKLTAQGQQAILTVADTGIGIAPEQVPKVFERFHRIKDAKSRTHEGTGIGLSMVQELVKLHGGTVTARSTVGEGTVFTVSIPLGAGHLPSERVQNSADDEAAISLGVSPFVEEALRWLPEETPDLPAAPTQTQLDSEPAIRQRIVLADDNADMLAYVKRLLAPIYDVIPVHDGQAALDEVGRQVPDLLITDVMMPGLDGFELLQHIRRNPKTRTLPVIMLSARAGEESSIEGLEAGADDYLVKPFVAKELLARVRSNLELSRVRREAEETMFQAQKMQVVGQLAGGVAHDFNSLLTVLVGNLTMLEKYVQEPSGQRMLDAALKATERCGNLTRQILAFARKQHLNPKQTNLNKLVAGMDEIFSRTLGGMVEVQTRLADDLWLTNVDQNQIELALLNLAINGRDAMPDGGVLTISTTNQTIKNPSDDLKAGDYVVLSVSDTGTGMSPETLSHAFEPFYTTKDIGKGTGLGLSQVYGVAQQLHGTARICSRSGEGTTVEILLPRFGAPKPAETDSNRDVAVSGT